MKTTKIMGSILLLTSAMALSACGGDSDSSGSSSSNDAPNSTTPTQPAQPTTPTQPTVDKCEAKGNNIYVPKDGKCSYSIPKYNNGALEVYECSGGRVSQNGISAGKIVFGDYTIQCAS